MKLNPIDEIIRFQTDRGLDKKEFNTVNENTNIVEELLESHGFDVPKEERPELKERWKDFIGSLNFKKKVKELTIDKIVDAYCDIIVFAIGAILKLGYDPREALLEASKEINSRRGEMIDGKFEKDLSEEAQALWYKADYSKAKMVQPSEKRIFLIKNPVVKRGRLVVDEPMMRAIYIVEPWELEKGDEVIDLKGCESLQQAIEDKELQLRGYGL